MYAVYDEEVEIMLRMCKSPCAQIICAMTVYSDISYLVCYVLTHNIHTLCSFIVWYYCIVL